MAPKGRKGKGTAPTLREKIGKSYTAEELQKAQEQLKKRVGRAVRVASGRLHAMV